MERSSNNVAFAIKMEVNSSDFPQIKMEQNSNVIDDEIKIGNDFSDIVSEIKMEDNSNHIGIERSNDKQQFQKRIIIREIEKSYVCDVCDKEFKHKSSLKVHYYTHLERKPHDCYVCSLSFTRKYRLVHHYLNHCKKKVITPQTSEKRPRKSQNPRKYTPPHKIKLHTCDMCFKGFAKLLLKKMGNRRIKSPSTEGI
ncbi:zinc finger protein [Nephila pilipes]|uniref:Zinc finger protein n=1 Tax=Nephila pilipes TaxID=299642 RepID=A0A8X6MUE4_NEPPI|nr:zinc finger protein [Nephila pilipes]